ncbi:hypothetical protein KR054_008048, partial [Drosophila jambulina]
SNSQLLILTGCCHMWSWSAESAAISGPVAVPILKSVAEQQSDGSYFFNYQAADGSYREEVGIVRRSDSKAAKADADHDNDDLEVSGIYHYIDDHGQTVEVSYTADKNGFLPHVKLI